MNKLLTVCLILVLSGCTTTVPVKQKFPDVPSALLETCPRLDTIDQEKIVFSDFLKVVTKNYTKYHSCAKLVEAWQLWYNEQKKISTDINK